MHKLNIVSRFRTYFRNQNQLLKDIRAGNQLAKLVAGTRYFPETNSSLNMHSLATVINDIVINDRKCYVEFGAGISTIYIASLAVQNSLDLKIYSIDDNSEWLNIMKGFLERESLLPFVKFVDAPLRPTKTSLNSLQWYDEQAIEEALAGNVVDAVLVDGPMAWTKEKALSRYPALPFIHEKLGERFSVFIDDTFRAGEREIINRWTKEFNLTFNRVNSVFSMASRGMAFNTIP